MAVESPDVGTSIIVLAAGSSERMGRPKPLLDFDGRTCLSLVVSACLDSRADDTILVLGAHEDAVRGTLNGLHLDGAPLKVVVNEHFTRGQTSTLKTGLEEVPPDADAFIVLPVDQPLVTAGDIDAVIEQFEPRPRGRTIFIAAHEEGRGHPVLFSARHRGPILELGDDEPLNAYVRLREGEVQQVNVDSPGVTLPMNTPDEYQMVLSVYRNRPSVEQDRA